MTTLLEKAKSFKHHDKTKYENPEYFELVKAWLNREVSITQIAKAITPSGKKVNANIGANMIITMIRKMRDRGVLKFEDERK